MENITVSIICMAYNHGKYIRKALEGFANQKTNFAFEILVHDDASTDNTSEIIAEYQSLYPKKLYPTYQSENLWSKRINIVLDIMLPQIRGEYVALCEGDDYWVDPLKLQKQVDYIRLHRDCALVAHDGIRIWEDGTLKARKFTDSEYREGRIITISELVGNLDAFPTASMLFRKSYYVQNLAFLRSVRNFDYLLKLLLSTSGYVYIMPDIMSAYRKGAADSWSSRMLSDNSKAIEHMQTSIASIKKLDKYTERKFTGALIKEIEQREISLAIMTRDWRRLLHKDFYKYFVRRSLRQKAIIYARIFFPKAFNLLLHARIKKHVSNSQS